MGSIGHRTAGSPDPVARTIGKLCMGGDWACAHGDLEALGDIAARLAGYAGEPLHRELVALSSQCRNDPDGATAAWVRLKNQVLQTAAPP
jgi:hypothetical protein